jgi:hypothetical protein
MAVLARRHRYERKAPVGDHYSGEPDMPSIHRIALATTLILGCVYASPAPAAYNRYLEFNGASSCQLSIPTTDTMVRPRANGYRNEGTTNQFVICGLSGYEAIDGKTGSATVLYAAMFATSTDGQTHQMTCTGVGGLTGYSSVLYSSKTQTVPAAGYALFKWEASDFGGTAGTPIPYSTALNLSVTCTLPSHVAVQSIEAKLQFTDS